MYRAGIIRIGLVALLSATALSAHGAVQELATVASAPALRAMRAGTGVVLGTAWRSDTTPFDRARLRLRNVTTGRGAGTAVSDREGRFRFDNVEPGPYVVELLGDNDRVLAVSDLFGVAAEQQVSTIVRLTSRTPFFGGVFGNAAAAAVAAASTLGITATGSNGQPISAQ